MHRTREGPRRLSLWRLALLAGIGVIAVSLGFDRVPGIHACGIANPVITLEFVTTPADVLAQLPAFCRSEQVAAHRTALWLDALLFIPVYSAFLIVSLLALARENARAMRLAATGCAAVVVAAMLDEVEGFQLFRLLAENPPSQDTLALLVPAVRGKFALLGLAAALAGWLLIRRRGWRLAAGVGICGGALLSVTGLVTDTSLVMRGNSIAWLTLIVVAAICAFSRRAFLPRT
jgi:hypothetical protein